MEIRRSELRDLLNRITSKPWKIISILGTRRQPVYLRYPPRNDVELGPFVRIGDHALIDGPDRRNPNIIIGPDGKRYNLMLSESNRRPGEKIVIQNEGEERWMIVKNYDRDNGSQGIHAAPPKGIGLSYSPEEHDLYLLAGFYNDNAKIQPNKEKRIGRFGSWRPYTQVCLRGVRQVNALGEQWTVVE